MNSLLIAIGLLTRLPVAHFVSPSPSDAEQQRSIYYYPLVGAVLAMVLCGVGALTSFIPSSLLSASVIVFFWIALTGALHLDGLADSWDAYFAHHGNAENTRQVLKDPSNGTMAVVAIVMVLVLKITALGLFISTKESFVPVLLATLVIPRMAILLLMLKTPYANEAGIAANLSVGQSARISYGVMAASIALLVLFLTAVELLFAVLSAALLLIWWRHLWVSMIGGYTGDVLGAYIEMSECLILLSITIVITL